MRARALAAAGLWLAACRPAQLPAPNAAVAGPAADESDPKVDSDPAAFLFDASELVTEEELDAGNRLRFWLYADGGAADECEQVAADLMRRRDRDALAHGGKRVKICANRYNPIGCAPYWLMPDGSRRFAGCIAPLDAAFCASCI